jgi:hypothetical protein
MSYLGKETSSLERLAEPELQGELIPDRYSGYQKTVYRDGFHAGYRHGLTCARAALAVEPVKPSDGEILKLTENISTEYLCKHKSLPSDWDLGDYASSTKGLIEFARAVLARWGKS